jgi:predicted nucleotidyltransferase
MGDRAFLSVRVSEDVRNRIKAIASGRGEKLQDLVGGLIERFLEEAERRPPELAVVLRQLRALEGLLRAKGVAALWIFGSVARGDARPDSDVDLAVAFRADTEPSLSTIAHLKEELGEVLGRRVDLGERSAMKPDVADAVERDMVRVF